MVDVRRHPVFGDLTERYRIALLAFRASSISPVAESFGMSEREYCDRFIAHNFHPFTWTAASTAGQEFHQGLYDAAYEAARRSLDEQERG